MWWRSGWLIAADLWGSNYLCCCSVVCFVWINERCNDRECCCTVRDCDVTLGVSRLNGVRACLLHFYKQILSM